MTHIYRICPWFLLGSAGIFITFIASYQVSGHFSFNWHTTKTDQAPPQIFLFSIIGVLLVDYYVVAKGRLDLAWMYTADRKGPYCKFRCCRYVDLLALMYEPYRA